MKNRGKYFIKFVTEYGHKIIYHNWITNKHVHMVGIGANWRWTCGLIPDFHENVL